MARCPPCSQNAHDETVLVRCAQSRAALATPLKGDVGSRKALARANGTSRRASGWAGENIARSWDHPSHPLKRDSSLRPCPRNGASLDEEAVLADSGRAGEIAAGVGRVRSPDFLSILRECPALGLACRQSNFCLAERFFPHLIGCLTRTEDLPKE